ncbi:MAG: diguanylate cyclase [Terracidiphilus sp.]|jgi:diguanylate cyclase (GGDEF)-like protein
MGRSRSIRVLACLLAFSAVLEAQQYVFRAYRQREGLKNVAVNALTADSSGFMWIATENGVYRFLGSNLELFGKDQGIAERDIQDIFADPNGIVWAGTDRNLYRWNGEHFLPVGDALIQIHGAQHLATEDAHHLLVVDNGRLYRLEHDAQGKMLSYVSVFSGNTLASIPALNQLSSVSVANGQTIWMGCGKKLCSWLDRNGGAVTEWGTDKGVPESVWHAVVLDHTGAVWVAGQQHHVIMLPLGATRFVDRNFNGPDPNNVYQHTAMVVDREDRVIVATEAGITRWEGAGWRPIDPSTGKHIGHITSLAFDTGGDLWLGSFGYGLYHWIGYGDWEGWTDLQGLPSANVLNAFPLREGRVLVGTEKGPGWVNPHSGMAGPLLLEHKWNDGQVSGIGANQDGSVWAGTYSGAVLRIDSKTGRVHQTAKLPALIIAAAQDPVGRIFFATAAGIYMREANASNAPPLRITAVDTLLGDSTRVDAACAAPDGTMWFLAANKLLRERDNRWTIPPIDGLPKLGGSFLDLSCGADGALWATGQRTGIWQFTPTGPRLKAWKLEIPARLNALAPLAILADRRGWVWLGTDWGLAVWNGREWRHLTQESGLVWNDVNKGTLTSGPDGSIWVETSGGLAHLAHPERIFDSVPMNVSVTGIERGDQVYSVAQQITLPWASVPLRFQISSPTMFNRGDLIFKYRMEGLQPEWSECADGVAIFSALPSGKYTFMAMAYNPGLNAFSTTVKMEVRILPPWWGSNWFYALCLVTFLLLLAAADRLRVRHLHGRSRELEMLVSERTKELEISRAQLRIQATHDGLTGMLNRTAILRALTAEMERAQRDKRSVVVALIDLDHFKHINDDYGHLAGDEGLRWFSAAVGTAIRPYDHAGRYGGEEFLLVLPEIPSDAVEQRLVGLHASISNLKIQIRGAIFLLNCSIGATVFNPTVGSASEESLLAIADQALYVAKAEGRNRVVFRAAIYSEPQQGPQVQL